MKNPFTNTQDYMIVREFNRITNRKRSNSSSSQSQSSFKSSQSSNMGDHGFINTPFRPTRRYNQEYLIQRAKPNLYDLQRKRAQVFGVQQLRYKPAYFNNFDSNVCQSQQKKIITEKKIIPSELKYQKSLKQLRFQDLSKRLEQNKNMDKEPIDEIKQQVKIQMPKSRRRASALQQMLTLNIKDDNKLNQFYTSTADLKSRHSIFKSNETIPSTSSKPKKCSIFHNQYDQFVVNKLPKEQKKTSNFQEQESESELSKYTESQIFQQSFSQIEKMNTTKQGPPLITVRNKIYYKYTKELI